MHFFEVWCESYRKTQQTFRTFFIPLSVWVCISLIHFVLFSSYHLIITLWRLHLTFHPYIEHCMWLSGVFLSSLYSILCFHHYARMLACLSRSGEWKFCMDLTAIRPSRHNLGKYSSVQPLCLVTKRLLLELLVCTWPFDLSFVVVIFVWCSSGFHQVCLTVLRCQGP